MSAVEDRSAAIETLHRMTSRLADSNLTAAEASVLRPVIHRLLEEIGQAGRADPAVTSIPAPEAAPRARIFRAKKDRQPARS
jgi:hypothetical protein